MKMVLGALVFAALFTSAIQQLTIPAPSAEIEAQGLDHKGPFQVYDKLVTQNMTLRPDESFSYLFSIPTPSWAFFVMPEDVTTDGETRLQYSLDGNPFTEPFISSKTLASYAEQLNLNGQLSAGFHILTLKNVGNHTIRIRQLWLRAILYP